MRLSNIIFKGFCEEGKQLHFRCLTTFSRGNDWADGCGGDDEEEEGDGESRVTPPPAPPQPPAPQRPLVLSAQCARPELITAIQAARSTESNKGKEMKRKSPCGLCHTLSHDLVALQAPSDQWHACLGASHITAGTNNPTS